MPATVRLKPRARNSSGFSQVGKNQGPKALSHHLLPLGVHISRRVELEMEPELESRHWFRMLMSQAAS